MLSPALRAAGAAGRVRVGLIGCGGMGKGDLATFLLNPEVECPVVCDPDENQMGGAATLIQEKRGSRPEMVRDFRRVLERQDVDCLLYTSPSPRD